jgi:hypothetical protein
MGTQQSRPGRGQQGTHNPSERIDRRPEQDRDLQRNKQSDRGQQRQQSDRNRQQQSASGSRPQQQGGSGSQQGNSATSNRQDEQAERQQSQLGGGRDFNHKMENEGREQNREQQAMNREQSDLDRLTNREHSGQSGPMNRQQQRGETGSANPQQGAQGGSAKQADRQQSGQNVYGEGNYAASRQYDKDVKNFAESGRAESAARAAAPKSRDEAREMEAAEQEGKRHSKGEDPALTRGASRQSPESPGKPRPGHEEE